MNAENEKQGDVKMRKKRNQYRKWVQGTRRWKKGCPPRAFSLGDERMAYLINEIGELGSKEVNIENWKHGEGAGWRSSSSHSEKEATQKEAAGMTYHSPLKSIHMFGLSTYPIGSSAAK